MATDNTQKQVRHFTQPALAPSFMNKHPAIPSHSIKADIPGYIITTFL